MRAFSRCSAVGVAGCAFGSVSCGSSSVTCLLSGLLLQAASASASAAASQSAGRVLVMAVSRVSLIARFSRHGFVGDLDLLGRVGLDHRAAALLEDAAHPDTAAFQPL